MKMISAVIATVLTVPLMSPANVNAQAPQNASTFTIAGHAGEAQILQLNGKSHVEIETLARLTGGTLSFKANRTILTLPPRMQRRRLPRRRQRRGSQELSPRRASKRWA